MQAKDLIKQKRLEKGLTTTELGKLVGVSHATISRWENGDINSMKQNKILALANALGISPIDILDAREPNLNEILEPGIVHYAALIVNDADLKELVNACLALKPDEIKALTLIAKAMIKQG